MPSEGEALSIDKKVVIASRKWELQKVSRKLDGSGTKIAVLDTAINIQYPPLQHHANSVNCLNDGAKTNHGTLCASVAVGKNGIAPKSQLYSYKIADDHKKVRGINKAVIDALKNIMTKKIQIDVVSISFSLSEEHKDELHEIIKELIIKMGVVFVAAGGNSGRYQPHAPVPACFEEVISVGALDANGYKYRMTSDGRIDVWAPGENITKDLECGTSLAAPAIAGLVLLLKQRAREIGPPASEIIHCPQVLKKILY